MSTADYREAAAQLRGLRTTLLAEHALRLPPSFNWRDHFEVWSLVHQTHHIHAHLGVPYSTTYEVLRQNRATILEQGGEASLPIVRFAVHSAVSTAP